MTARRLILLRPRNISDKIRIEDQNTLLPFKTSVFRKWCLFEITWGKYGTDRQATHDNQIQRMPFACWITKATHTCSEYVIFIVFP